MAIADKIQILRKARGLSQEQLANEMYVSRQAVSKWESGQSEPDTDKVIILSKFFGVTTDYLLMSDDEAVQSLVQVQVNDNERKKSKQMIIGIIIFCSGLFTVMGIIIAAALNVPHTDGWLRHYPSKLWFLIFEGNGMFLDSPKGLGLGPVFIIGVALAVLGLALLVWEYFHKDSESSKNRT